LKLLRPAPSLSNYLLFIKILTTLAFITQAKCQNEKIIKRDK